MDLPKRLQVYYRKNNIGEWVFSYVCKEDGEYLFSPEGIHAFSDEITKFMELIFALLNKQGVEIRRYYEEKPPST